jgi:hypothetical protein
MKPYITPKLTESGKKLLQFQLEGIDLRGIWNTICRNQVTGFSMPNGHTFTSTWEFHLHFCEENIIIDFSSACTEVKEWQEVGSLNMRFVLAGTVDNIATTPNILKHAIPFFSVEGLQKLIYEDDDVISECGLVFLGPNGAEIVIAAGISPGSVSVAAPFSTEPFEPQFSLSTCRREIVDHQSETGAKHGT